MAKSRRRKVSREKASGAGMTQMNRSGFGGLGRPLLLIAVLGALVLAGVFGYDRWRASQARGPFEALLASGQGGLDQVETTASDGQTHLRPGETYGYSSSFPTSGPHAPVPAAPGFYESPQPLEALVHAVEHGHIVVYYDAPGDTVLELLRGWSRLFQGHWSGFLAVPHRGLGKKVVLTAWRRRLDLEPFDAATAARFVDAYRGRGPENAVR